MYKKLIFSYLLISIIGCNNSKEAFSIKADQLKSIYSNSESVILEIENKENEEISSVEYYLNETKIGETKNNLPFKYNLATVKFGLQEVKAIVNSDEEKIECLASFQVFPKQEPTLLKYNITDTYSHDKSAYTQGVELYKGIMIESTGLEGQSSLRKTDFKTGKIIQKIELSSDVFGEGITIMNEKIYQLTWKNNKGYIYDANNLTKISEFSYPKQMEGWGLTNNGKELIMSDGSDKIYFLKPDTFKITRELTVCSNLKTIDQINELEYINGKIWANVYQENIVIVINPETGAIEQVMDLSNLVEKVTNEEKAELNGIAYNKAKNSVLIYGKNYDKSFEIKLQ